MNANTRNRLRTVRAAFIGIVCIVAFWLALTYTARGGVR